MAKHIHRNNGTVFHVHEDGSAQILGASGMASIVYLRPHDVIDLYNACLDARYEGKLDQHPRIGECGTERISPSPPFKEDMGQ